MTRFIRSLFGKTKTIRTAPSAARARLGLETLDRRDMPSATANLASATGELTITGTDAVDQVSIAENQILQAPLLVLGGVSSVTYDGKPWATSAIPNYLVRSLNVYLKGGSDTLTVQRSYYVDDVTTNIWVLNPYYSVLQSIRVDGGEGDNRIDLRGSNFAPATVVCGSGNDTIFGGMGNDFIQSDGGNNYVDGGSGDDYITAGGGGTNTLLGGYGNDTIWGGWGNDELYGGAGNDVLRGSAGNDRLYGEGGDDTLYGMDGNDSLYGGDGDDDLYGGNNDDFLMGGCGNDGLYGGMGQDTLIGGNTAGPYESIASKGKDRFLILANEPVAGGGVTNDTILDFHSAVDAQIDFANGAGLTTSFSGQPGRYTYSAGTFTSGEIEQVDKAFSLLEHRTHNTKLLKYAGGTDLHFERQGTLVASVGGTFSSGGWNSGGAIHMIDNSFSSDTNVERVVLHEIGHNFDDAGENPTVADFQALSGWTTTTNSLSYSPLTGWSANPKTGLTMATATDGVTPTGWWYSTAAQMVSMYARTNPQEDFAESFMAYYGVSGDRAAAPWKMAYMDGFMNWAAAAE